MTHILIRWGIWGKGEYRNINIRAQDDTWNSIANCIRDYCLQNNLSLNILTLFPINAYTSSPLLKHVVFSSWFEILRNPIEKQLGENYLYAGLHHPDVLEE